MTRSSTTTTPATTETGSATGTPAELGATGLVMLLVGVGLSIVDFFIVNIALPTIDRTLGAGPTALQIVVAGYGIAYGTLLVLGGRLGDALGRRRTFLLGLAGFTLTSLACGLAPNVETLVGARVAQGVTAALMVPQVLSIIAATTTGERRSRAMGWYGATSGLAMIAGQLFGGLLVAADVAGLGWRPIFLVNVPIGLVALVVAARTLPESRATDPAPVDRTGTLLFGTLLLTLLVPLTVGRTLGWPVWAWVALAGVPVLTAVFLANQRSQERAGRMPLVPPSVVTAASMRLGLLLAGPFFLAFGAFMFVYAVTLQDGLRLSPTTVGLAITPMAAGFLVASLASSRLVGAHGHRVVIAGAVAQVVGVAALGGTVLLTWPDLQVPLLIPGMAVAGFGQGLAMTTMFRVALSRVPADRAGAGSGVLVTTQQVSVAAGVATIGTLFLWLAEPSVVGYRNAFVLVMAIQIVVAIAIAVTGRWLPDPRVPASDGAR